MKKVIPVFFALVLILILLPAPEAKADYHEGDICPACNTNHLVLMATYSDTHRFECDDYQPDPSWNCGNIIIESHYGGAATCEEAAVCDGCGSSYDNPLGHDWVPPTCTEPGYCKRCSTPGESALGHDWMDADCTNPKRCSRCDTTEGEALGHSFTNYVSNNDATCEADGTKTAKCDRCDETDTIADEGSALGHRLVKTDRVDPNCEEEGTEEYWTCPVCKKMFSDADGTAEIPAPVSIPSSDSAHKPGKAVVENEEINCVSDSSYDEVVYCTVCKKELSREHITYESSHDYQPWEWHETITRKYFKCTKCGHFYWLHNPESWNMKPGLVRYSNGASVDYKAYATGSDDNGILTVVPVKHTERDNTADISLYLTPDDVYVWVWEKMNRIELVRDHAVLAIDPREITPAMFGLESENDIDLYLFTLTPQGEDSWLVRAEALSGIKKTPAGELKGITLTANGRESVITANGVYKAE